MELSKPLYTERIMTRAILPMAIPAALIAEIMFITLCVFFANRYLKAIWNWFLIRYFFSRSSMCST